MQSIIELRTYEGNLLHSNAFFAEYEVQTIYVAPKQPKNRIERKKRSEMICRFCSKKKPETSFTSKPHIISRLFGNNAGISDFECDNCNNHFSKFETSMADFLGVNRTIYSLGKEKIPTFKAADKSIEARGSEIFGHEAVEISAKMPGLISSLSETGQIEMQFKNNSYVPINVYKSLLKIALTIMPESEFRNYGLVKDFLLSDLNPKHFAPHATSVYRSQIGGEVAMPYGILCKKKNATSDLPTHIFQLYFQDSCLQLHLPYHKTDKQLVELEKLVIPMCPPFVFTTTPLPGKANYVTLDLSSSEKKLGEVNKMYLNFETDKIQETISVDKDKGLIGNNNFDPNDIVSVLFTRDKPENL